MARQREPAVRLRLSPSQDAVIYGPGRAMLVRSSQTWYLNEREMRTLIEEWTRYEHERRPAVDVASP